MVFDLPTEVAGIRLCKVLRNDDLVLCETVIFKNGRSAVDTVLRRAAISGKVGPIGGTGDFWADLMNSEGDTIVETIALDRWAWNAIKRKWARCKIEAPLRQRLIAAGLR
jgi:hypothetical protein